MIKHILKSILSAKFKLHPSYMEMKLNDFQVGFLGKSEISNYWWEM